MGVDVLLQRLMMGVVSVPGWTGIGELRGLGLSRLTRMVHVRGVQGSGGAEWHVKWARSNGDGLRLWMWWNL